MGSDKGIRYWYWQQQEMMMLMIIINQIHSNKPKKNNKPTKGNVYGVLSSSNYNYKMYILVQS